MKVFVAGASGAIGRPLVRQLVAAGHEVTGMTRREESAEAIRAAGAEAVVCDVFDAAALRERRSSRRPPEVVVNELTSLPPRLQPASKDSSTAPTNRVRSEGDAQPDRGGAGRRRAAPDRRERRLPLRARGRLGQGRGRPDLRRRARAVRRGACEALAELEPQVLGAEGIEGVVLRYGWFYGPGTYYDRDGSRPRKSHKRRLPIVGKGTGTFSFIHVEDAAERDRRRGRARRARASTTWSTTSRRR